MTIKKNKKEHMKIKLSAQNPFEWIALNANLVPRPLIETQIYFTSARIIMAGAELGIYDAVGSDLKSAEEIAQTCKTDLRATQQLLNALVGIGYLKIRGKNYCIPKKMQKWLLKTSEANLINKLRFQIFEWNFLNHLEGYVRTGKSLDVHSDNNPHMWKSYQEGMRDLSVNAAKEFAGKIPVPAGAVKMLDIGGSHGLYSVEICKKHKGLSSVILELPQAIASASAIAKRYDQSGQISYREGNVLTDDLGENEYDLIMINNVVHHFTAEQNEKLAKKVTRALKSGGIYAVGEIISNDRPDKSDVMSASTGLYFSLTSQSGNWSESEIKDWQTKAGLKYVKSIPAMTVPGFKIVVSKKV